ncbi:MAG: hypothetical protein HY322_05180 [Betaproteobacteria bacterium]|nr:hypothetical protein [Betaproteobacteria bacterium]
MIDVRLHEVGTRDRLQSAAAAQFRGERAARRNDQFPSLRHTNSPLALM